MSYVNYISEKKIPHKKNKEIEGSMLRSCCLGVNSAPTPWVTGFPLLG